MAFLELWILIGGMAVVNAAAILQHPMEPPMPPSRPSSAVELRCNFTYQLTPPGWTRAQMDGRRYWIRASTLPSYFQFSRGFRAESYLDLSLHNQTAPDGFPSGERGVFDVSFRVPGPHEPSRGVTTEVPVTRLENGEFSFALGQDPADDSTRLYVRIQDWVDVQGERFWLWTTCFYFTSALQMTLFSDKMAVEEEDVDRAREAFQILSRKYAHVYPESFHTNVSYPLIV